MSDRHYAWYIPAHVYEKKDIELVLIKEADSILIWVKKLYDTNTKLLQNLPKTSTANKFLLTWLTNTTELAPIAAPKAPNIGRGLTGWGVGMEALGFPEDEKQSLNTSKLENTKLHLH